MNILVANNHLVQTGGTENYTYAIIVELLRLGYNVEYFTFEKGYVSELIESLGVKFKRRKIYDLIIANHTTTIEALHKRGYIIQTCHGIYPDLEQPSEYADSYVSITFEVQQHLERKGFKSTLINNGIDCERFFPKRQVSKELSCVLSLCHSDYANSFIEDCCMELDIKFVNVDKYTDNVWNLEDIINKADLVVGIGRSLYDAMACGRPVISFDKRDYSEALGDGYLCKENISQSLKYNCSGRGTRKAFDKLSFIEELKKYNYQDGQFMREFALNNLNIKCSVEHYLNLKSKTEIRMIMAKKYLCLAYFYIKNRISPKS